MGAMRPLIGLLAAFMLVCAVIAVSHDGPGLAAAARSQAPERDARPAGARYEYRDPYGSRHGYGRNSAEYKQDEYPRQHPDRDGPGHDDAESYGPDRSSYYSDRVINLKFVERFINDTHTDVCTLPRPDGLPCTFASVDVICNAHKERTEYTEEPQHNSRYEDSDGLAPLIEDTPKSLAIGVMKTVSATSKAADWRQVKLGKQWGYKVGKISGEITFGAEAGSCNALLAGAKATFTEVSVYAMVTKTSMPVTPATLRSFAGYATHLSQPPPPPPPPPCDPANPDCARLCDPISDPLCARFGVGFRQPGRTLLQDEVEVASVDGDTNAAGKAYPNIPKLDLGVNFDHVNRLHDLYRGDLKVVGDWVRDNYGQARDLLKEDVAALRDQVIDDARSLHDAAGRRLRRLRDTLFTYCGVTFVARGDVVITKGTDTYVGTIESPLLWNDNLHRLPSFLLTPAPFNGAAPPSTSRPTGLVGIDVQQAVNRVLDVGGLAQLCHGPDGHDVPKSNPGSIRLRLSA